MIETELRKVHIPKKQTVDVPQQNNEVQHSHIEHISTQLQRMTRFKTIQENELCRFK
jgi:hypothetical protein